MNTTLGVALSVLAGLLAWGLPRILMPMPAIAERIFWIAVVVGLVASSKIPEPYNLGIMGLLAGMALFENLHQRYKKRVAARLAAKLEKEARAKENRLRSRTKVRQSPQDPPQA